MYIVEQKPVAYNRAGRLTNPITAQMRKLAVGESFLVSYADPNWTGSQVRNENMQHDAQYATEKEADGFRIGRVK